MRKFLIAPTFCVLILLLQSCSDSSSHLKQGTPQNERRHFYLTAEDPIVFVTSVPLVSDNGPLSAFSNHATSILDSIPGGDLYIRYPNGDLRNLTAEAGWGISSGELQAGSRAIAVRQPFVHWGGNKVLFSMLVGGPVARFDRVYERKWQNCNI